MKTGSAETSASLLAAKHQYRSLVEKIGEPFALPELIRRAEKIGLPRPHATINALLQAGVILPDETGFYLWRS